MTNATHCQHCGGSLIEKVTPGETRSRQVCVSCNRVHYRQLLVGVGALIEKDDSLLLIRRSKEPFANTWALPGGHVEADEDPQDRAMEEVKEETSVDAKPDGVAGVYFHNTHPRGPALFLSYWATTVTGAPSPSEEASECKFFARNKLPVDLAQGGHSIAIEAWRSNKVFVRGTLAELERNELWSQLSNSANLRSSQDQVLWTIFGAFWATNAILLVALFTTGDLPTNHWVGVVVAAIGVALSLVWHQIQNRALHHIVRHETTMYAIESQLRVSPRFAVSARLSEATASRDSQPKPRARSLMPLCSAAGAICWVLALVAFAFKA